MLSKQTRKEYTSWNNCKASTTLYKHTPHLEYTMECLDYMMYALVVSSRAPYNHALNSMRQYRPHVLQRLSVTHKTDSARTKATYRDRARQRDRDALQTVSVPHGIISNTFAINMFVCALSALRNSRSGTRMGGLHARKHARTHVGTHAPEVPLKEDAITINTTTTSCSVLSMRQPPIHRPHFSSLRCCMMAL